MSMAGDHPSMPGGMEQERGWRSPRRPGLGPCAPGGRDNIISESPGAGGLMIPRFLGFVPGLSPLTHWLPSRESPGQPAGFSLPLGVSRKQRQPFCKLSSSGVRPPQVERKQIEMTATLTPGSAH